MFRPLPFFYDLYTFRGHEGQTAVVAAFAVPVDELERERTSEGSQYRFDVTLVLADTAVRTVARSDDSVVVKVPYRLPGHHLLHTHTQVEAPPSTKTLQRVIMTDASTPGIGQLYETPFAIPDYSGDALMISDVALGRPGVGGGWSRGGVTLALFPTSQFPQGSFEVYYEVYNLPDGAAYGTEMTLQRLDDDGVPQGETTARTRFSGIAKAASDGTVVELRQVDAPLKKGRYRLTVTVRDEASARSVSRFRDFQVRGGGRGATLVHALPRGPGGAGAEG